MERDRGFDDGGAKNGESFVVFFGEGGVSHGSTEKISALEGVPDPEKKNCLRNN